ncbi:helix-turn-helix domain-containing protein [Corynebacterium uropygiale]|uniref:Helix-turn-helix domain-containing protein n=1 Tax=Corynebacterium uropygiale TaxID=1775911 RepID=A0A9X1QS18_9CORY|nr:helix-turn-helix domain-containing protein [Corynebacterium uropygiale]MCF4007711.1 helix-turn-helix domain-containing protein [Corynebacterium uropygiale]
MRITPDEVMELLDQGMSQAEIARQVGVTRQYIYKLAREGGYEPKWTKLTQHIPWDIPSEFKGNALYQGFRAIGWVRWRGPASLTQSQYERARAIWRKLKAFNQVIDFDPKYPAVPGLTNGPGFAYVPRRESDGDYMIRIKPGVKLTPVGKKIWRMPEEWPERKE